MSTSTIASRRNSKALRSIGNRPFLQWQLYSLAERGIDHFVLALGHNSKIVETALKEPWAKSLRIDIVVETKPLGTGGAVNFAMRSKDLDEALVVNGDTIVCGSLDVMFVPLDLNALEFLRLAIVEVDNQSRFGGVEIDSENNVTKFVEKGLPNSGFINAGFYRIHKKAFAMETDINFSLEKSTLSKLASFKGLQARKLKGPFIDIGVPDDYYFLSNNYRLFVDNE